jgi:hypothetical protein
LGEGLDQRTFVVKIGGWCSYLLLDDRLNVLEDSDVVDGDAIARLLLVRERGDGLTLGLDGDGMARIWHDRGDDECIPLLLVEFV